MVRGPDDARRLPPARQAATWIAAVGLGFLATLAAGAAGAADATAAATATAAAIQKIVVGLVESSPESRSLRPRLDALHRIYGRTGFEPIWFANEGARPDVSVALAELRTAEWRGLEVDALALDALEREVAAATGTSPSPAQVARADVALTNRVLQLLIELRAGRVPPREVEPHFRATPRDLWFLESLADAVANGRLRALIDEAEPSFLLYGRLERLLAQYRSLAMQPWPPLPALPPKLTKIEPGSSYAGAWELRDRLVRLGDLAAGAAGPVDDRYAGALVDGVRQFQRRHGLAQDGVLGPQTLAELDVPPGRRVRQIELSMERLRWLPDLPSGPMIVVNIPSFRLRVLADAPVSDRPVLAMPVIVGRAVRTETPVFIGEMRYVEFSPYWNVPPSILRNELLPTLARDPSYLARNDMELVATRGGGRATTTVDRSTLAGLAAGDLRMRQRPGAKNALGGVKFVLPNDMNIYLHGTPARELFERTRRDFSHGCIRVGDPKGLARFVLRDQPEWTDERIAAAMIAGTTATVRLTTTVPVVVFYTTAIVDNDGRALFLADVYGHDRKLDEALQAVRAASR
jgi:L,D-transpeptidase YcbB